MEHLKEKENEQQEVKGGLMLRRGGKRVVDHIYKIPGTKAEIHCASYTSKQFDNWNDKHTTISKNRKTRGQTKLDNTAFEREILDHVVVYFKGFVDENGPVEFDEKTKVDDIKDMPSTIYNDFFDFVLNDLKAEAQGNPQT